jgi:hypothetical protein
MYTLHAWGIRREHIRPMSVETVSEFPNLIKSHDNIGDISGNTCFIALIGETRTSLESFHGSVAESAYYRFQNIQSRPDETAIRSLFTFIEHYN